MLSRLIRVYFLFFSCLVLFIVLNSSLHAQSISAQIKQADCDFEIYYKDQKLDIIKQLITKRCALINHSEGDYTYNSYFLEFQYNSESKIKERGAVLVIQFFSKSGELLIKTVLRDEEWKENIGNGLIKNFSLSLIDVPVFVLDDTFKIVITK